MIQPVDPSAAPRPIRDAATVVLLRDGARGPEVLMVKRNRGAVFMADAHVFPGGKLDDSDGGDFIVAAAREAFEEAGVVLAVDARGETPVLDGAAWVEPARAAVLAGTERFVDVLAAHGLAIDPARFVLFARWITPPTESRRFDARFLIARVPEGQKGAPDAAGEVVDFRWDTPAALLAAQARGEIKLPPPTLWHLTDLARFTTVDEALAWARTHSLHPVRPKLWDLGGVISIVLPWDPDYEAIPIEGEALDAAHPAAGAITRYEIIDGLWRGRTVTRGA